jgi:hypothetical protein
MPRGANQANFDLYNAFNASSILAITNTYGQLWLRPADSAGAVAEFGGQVRF